MDFIKSSLKKQIEVMVVDGKPKTVEFFDGRFQADIVAGDTMESMRAEMHQWVDRKCNDLMAAELRLMPDRIEEGKQLALNGFFENQAGDIGDIVRDFINNVAGVDVEIRSGGRSVRVPKPGLNDL